MTELEFQSVQPVAEALEDEVDRWFASAHLRQLKEALLAAAAKLPPTVSLSVDVEVRVFDEVRGRGLKVQTASLINSGGEVKCAWPNATPQRYVADGELCVLPHDRCPRCWGAWDKTLRRSCRRCGAAFGRDVKLLLDTDVCPHCETGRVTIDEPTCAECKRTVDPGFVHWG